jgi:hypothetical protein
MRIRIRHTTVTLLILIQHPIPATGEHAILTASICHDVGVAATIVTLLPFLENTIATLFEAAHLAAPVATESPTVITLFPFVDHPIATPGKRAIGPAVIRGLIEVEGAIIALLARLDNAVATDLHLARATTAVTALCVPVIAALPPVENTIATSRHHAIGTTAIRGYFRVEHAVVALFTLIDDAIPAARILAVFPTVVWLGIIVLVPFVTLLTIIFDPITTRGQPTVHAARIGGTVAVANSLITLLACIYDIVTTGRTHAGRAALIGYQVRVVFSTVAELSPVQHTIPASRKEAITATGVRSSIRVVCTSITFLSLLLDAIAAAGLRTRIGTIVIIHRIAVIALFPLLEDAVPTRCRGSRVFLRVEEVGFLGHPQRLFRRKSHHLRKRRRQ